MTVKILRIGIRCETVYVTSENWGSSEGSYLETRNTIVLLILYVPHPRLDDKENRQVFFSLS